MLKQTLNEAELKLLKLSESGDFIEAEKVATKIIETFPDHIASWSILGVLRAQRGNLIEALDAFKIAAEIAPSDATILNNIGLTLKKMNKPGEAIDTYRKAIALSPNYIEVRCNLGALLREQGELNWAEEVLREGDRLNSDFSGLQVHLGNVMKDLGRLDEALMRYKLAVKIDPLDFEAHFNLGNLQKELGQDNEAETSLANSIAIKPDFADANYNLGRIYLERGDFEAGFRLYEWRWRIKEFTGIYLNSSKPSWTGEPNAVVYIWSEQGIGDVLLYATVLKSALDRSRSLIFSCDERLLPLFERSFPAGVNFIPQGMVVPEDSYDYQLPIGSLPRLFRKDRDSFSQGARTCLSPDPSKVLQLKKKFENFEEGPICGISWRGGKGLNARSRSINLEVLAESLSDLKFSLLSLQYDATTEELQRLKTDYGLTVNALPEVDNFADLDGLAALLSLCDHVISVDNTTAHLAGTLGVKARVLLPMSAEWLWGRGSSESYWYDSLLLYRQDKLGDWSGVLRRVKEDLEA